MNEVNHGPLTGGGFWAGFCSNPDCNVLGCPGDCQDSPKAQLVAPAPDTASVLAGLVESLRGAADMHWAAWERDGDVERKHRSFGLADAIDHVQMATSGDGKAMSATDLIPPRGWCPECDGPSECAPGTCPGVGAPEAERGIHRLLDSVQTEARRLGFCCYAAAIAPNDPCPWHAAPPAPSAPGVAALLAECWRRQEFAPDTGISCDEIVRYLAPEGADGTEEGA